MVERKLTVLNVDQQHSLVKNIGSLKDYLEFECSYFSGSVAWRTAVCAEDANKKPDPDYFRFLGLVSILCAQYGYESLLGGVIWHNRSGWKNSPDEAKHQLGLACYMGSLNEQSFQIKQTIISDKCRSQNGQYRVWGAKLKIEHGTVTPKLLEDRSTHNLPFFLTDIETNQNLARIDFSGNSAESMHEEKFEETILPRVADAIGNILDPIPVFTSHRRRSFPAIVLSK